MIQIAWPWLLLLLPLPWLMRRLLKPAANQHGSALFAPFVGRQQGAQQMIRPQVSRRWPLWLASVIWLCLIAAAIKPQWLGDPITIPQAGRNLVLAIDVSGSMKTPDMVNRGHTVSRLDVVKTIANNFIGERKGDRIGLLLFGSQAYLQSPLTFDHEAVQHFLSQAVIGIAGRETAIGDTIGLAIKRLKQAPEGKAVLILLTDGQNTAGAVSPLGAAQAAAQENLKIYTIGIGAQRMMVDSFFGGRVVNPSRGLDEETLKTIAQTTGGQYFRARDADELQAIYEQLDELEPLETDNRVVRPLKELYYWPLGLAFALSLLLALLKLVFSGNRKVKQEAA